MTTKILSVDDSSLMRLAIARVFAPYDCLVLQAEDGEKGFAATVEHRPDLIILDYNMPVLDGVGMLRKLRGDPQVARTRVIMLTANSAPEIVATVARLGVRDYLIKPFDDETLLGKAAKLIALVPKTPTES
jgi:two-component system cell cycle response regulator